MIKVFLARLEGTTPGFKPIFSKLLFILLHAQPGFAVRYEGVCLLLAVLLSKETIITPPNSISPVFKKVL